MSERDTKKTAGQAGLMQKWFGEGRVFGIQTGNLDQRIRDAHVKSSDLVKFAFQDRTRTFTREQLDALARRLSSDINSGLADKLLMQELENLVPYFPISSSGFQIIHNNPLHPYHLYINTVQQITSEAGIPQLLEALNSKLGVYEDIPFEHTPRKSELKSEEQIESTGNYKVYWYDHYQVFYQVDEWQTLHKMRKPISQAAYAGLEMLLPHVKETLTLSDQIDEQTKKYVALIDQPHTIQHSERKDVQYGKVYLGWSQEGTPGSDLHQ